MNSSYDVVIIGGGVSGSSTAYFLAAQKSFDGKVLVVERDSTYEHTPSARAIGGIRQQFSTPENILIGLFGAYFIKHIDQYLSVDDGAPDIGFKESGYLLLASPEALPMMHDNHAVQRKHGAEIVFQSPSELKTHFPWLNTEDLAGGFLGLSNEGWLDPYGLLQAFRRRARSLGVTYIDDEAIGVARQGSRAGPVTLRDAGQIEAGVVVNAAGARDAAHIAGLVGIELPVEPRKRCVFVFECREAMGRIPLTIFTNGLGVRPEGRGFLCNMAPPPGHDPVTSKVEVDYALFDDVLWPTLAQRIPAFESIKLLNAYTCHYDVNTLDGNVIIGRPPELDNFYLVAGFSGHGLMQSPAIGRAMSELVTFGEYRTLDLTRFGYERVLTGEKIQETNCY